MKDQIKKIDKWIENDMGTGHNVSLKSRNVFKKGSDNFLS